MEGLGFCWLGAVYLCLLFVPNLLWARHQPPGYDSGGESRVLLLLERVGEVLVTTFALIFTGLNPQMPPSGWSLWLAASLVCMALYEMYWLRYFRGGNTLKDFYGPFCGVPVPGASLPVAAFLLLAVYGRALWLALSCVVLGVGHIGIHLQHARGMRQAPRPTNG